MVLCFATLRKKLDSQAFFFLFCALRASNAREARSAQKEEGAAAFQKPGAN